MLVVAPVTLFVQRGSGLNDAVHATNPARPVLRALNVTVNVAVLFAPSDDTRHVTTLRHQLPPLLFDTRDTDGGKANDAHTFFATAGPAFRTVIVQVAFVFAFTDAGHANDTDTSAFVDGGGGLVTVTLYGPAVAFPARFDAITE